MEGYPSIRAEFFSLLIAVQILVKTEIEIPQLLGYPTCPSVNVTIEVGQKHY